MKNEETKLTNGNGRGQEEKKEENEKERGQVGTRDKKEKEKDKFYRLLRMYMNKFSITGILLILVAAVLSCVIELIPAANGFLVFIISVFTNMLNTVGIALCIGAIFDFAKNSKDFLSFVSDILEKIVVSQEFLSIMDEKDKRRVLEQVLRPSGVQIEECSSIELFYKKSIDSMMNLYAKNFKTNLIITIEIMKENDVVVARGELTHRIYKVNNSYLPIYTTFEHEDSKIVNSYILTPGQKKVEMKSENINTENYDGKKNDGIALKYITEIPESYKNEDYLTICREIYEKGNDHWINFHWTALTACDGIYFKVFCRDGISVKDHLVFDDKKLYDITMNDSHTEMTIISNSWLDPYTGFTLTASDSVHNM